ncbi:hypothetical protein [Legionella cardiaca]|uniref:Uncharacterized protein n=1 Tax=Legionella cardiaca TaxID=1071983 RepID=A0ABY8ATJ9_9GAMM|nr:hypothetical protein [Legionella cardiaca]WED42835.1 hypothetical protein PXX05_13170 [Legionella cardiaca]
MGKKAYSSAIMFLRDVTGLNFFGWVDDDHNVDAVVYIPYSDIGKLASVLIIPENIRKNMKMDITSSFIRLAVPRINSHPMLTYLDKFQQKKEPEKKKDDLSEQRALRIATVSMPTGTFAKIAPRTIEAQINLFEEHVCSAYELMAKQGKFFPDEIAICVMPEFYSHCSSSGQSCLFMPHSLQQELLAGYCNTSTRYPELLIMVNLTATTPNPVTDTVGENIGHKPKLQKTNMLFGIKNGAIVYASYKLNKGPADIPESELVFSEAERNTYWHGSVDKQLMPLAYLKQLKGVTFAGSVCIDAAEGVLGKYLRKHFEDFNEDEFGPAIQIISSSSMTLPIGYRKRSELDPMQVVTPRISQGLIIQADGHDREKRSGVWLVEGESFIRQEASATAVLSNAVRIESYSVNVKLLHNKLHDHVGVDIEEEHASSPSLSGEKN